MEQAIAALSNGKAPGYDSITTEIYKAGGTRLVIKIKELFETINFGVQRESCRNLRMPLLSISTREKASVKWEREYVFDGKQYCRQRTCVFAKSLLPRYL